MSNIKIFQNNLLIMLKPVLAENAVDLKKKHAKNIYSNEE